MKFIAGLLSLLFFSELSCQENMPASVSKYNFKSDFFVTWGYNRSQFTKSDIEFRGPDYHFTLHNVAAADRPSPFEAKVYFNPSKLSIPQFNFRAGYFLNEKISLSIGYDHMKYVAVTDQQTFITGTIDSSASETYAGVYDNTPIIFSRDFLQYEHTNGCNYISFETDFYLHPVVSANKKYWLSFHSGLGLGIMMPRSDVSVFGVQGANLFHLAGYGASTSAGFDFGFLKHFYLQFILKGGYINLPNVLTFKKEGYKASQHFFFLEEIGTVGCRFVLFGKRLTND